jgi:hypothetical protein
VKGERKFRREKNPISFIIFLTSPEKPNTHTEPNIHHPDKKFHQQNQHKFSTVHSTHKPHTNISNQKSKQPKIQHNTRTQIHSNNPKKTTHTNTGTNRNERKGKKKHNKRERNGGDVRPRERKRV